MDDLDGGYVVSTERFYLCDSWLEEIEVAAANGNLSLSCFVR